MNNANTPNRFAPHFTPSSSMLTDMVASAMARFDAAAKETRADARMERAMVAEAKARGLMARWG